MPIYLQFGTIKGDITSKGHEGWIRVNSFQWGIGRGISAATGSADNRTASGASCSEVTITKILDPSTTDLMQDLFKGNLKTTCQIDFVETKDNNVFYSVVLTNTGISGMSVSSGGDARPDESMSLNFTKIAITNKKADATGVQTPTTVTYDIGQESLV
jgi:type VI secretion system secreted protein Hcp